VTIPEFDEIRIVRRTETGTKVIQSTLPSDAKLKEKFRKELDPREMRFFLREKS